MKLACRIGLAFLIVCAVPLAATAVPIIIPCMFTTTPPTAWTAFPGPSSIKGNFSATLGCVPGTLGNNCN